MSKKEKAEQLIKILTSTSKPLSASELSKILNVSDRTVRNYIAGLNSEENYEIESDKGYYYLKKHPSDFSNNDAEESKVRARKLLSKLLVSKEGISVFDEADEMSVSESTIINVIIPEIKKTISEFDLTITSSNYNYFLNGSEMNKRKLIGKLITTDNYGFFSSTNALEKMFPDTKIQNIISGLYLLIDASDFYINDYSLNNLLTHISIIALRLETENNLGSIIEVPVGFCADNSAIINLAQQIASLIENCMGKKISESDFNQIVALISVSIDHDTEDIYSMVDFEFVSSIMQMLKKLCKRYGLDDFDNDFVVQIALHMHLAKQRSALNLSYPNPLKNQIKKEYAPIYDMAVYFCHLFYDRYKVEFSEEEISFVAFHIGANLENANVNRNKISCCLVIEDYHELKKKIIEKLNSIFYEDINIVSAYSYDQYMLYEPKCQLVLTTIPVKNNNHTVIISPLLKKANIQEIRAAIDDINNEEKAEKTLIFLKNMLNEQLYFRNVILRSKEEYINFICNACVKTGTVNMDFIDDVLLRESLSNTAFTDYLAIPHAITQYSNKTFMCVVHNDKPIEWGNKQVRFIFLIGVSENDMKHFSDTIDLIVNIFDSTQRVLSLLKTDDFDSFKKELCKI